MKTLFSAVRCSSLTPTRRLIKAEKPMSLAMANENTRRGALQRAGVGKISELSAELTVADGGGEPKRKALLLQRPESRGPPGS